MMDFFRQDLREALRSLQRTPSFSAVAILTLAVGMGVTTAGFGILDASLLRALPYPEPDRLVQIAEWPSSGGNYTVAPFALNEWRPRVKSFTGLEARLVGPVAIDDTGNPEQVRGAAVTTGYFRAVRHDCAPRPPVRRDRRPR